MVLKAVFAFREKHLLSTKQSFRRKFGWSPKGKPNVRTYAIGDIHGCLEQLNDLLMQIKAHNDYRHETETYIIFLGDVIDRGPDSKGVVELLIDFPYDFARPLFIMGNHEEMFVRSLVDEPRLLPQWLEHGGFACAESYGVGRNSLLGQNTEALKHNLLSAIPQKHVAFLSEFLEFVKVGDFLFTHAGIRPGVALELQNARELRWIRHQFLNYEGDHGFVVVHGHTITDDIEIRTNRIGLDTGAYETGRLSAICVEEDDITFFSTS